MEQAKFVGGSAIVMVLLALLGYWAVTTMQSGSEYVHAGKIKQLESENEELKAQVEALSSNELALTDSTPDTVRPSEEQKPAEEKQQEPKQPEKPAQTTYKNQTLINELQKMLDSKVVLKLTSKGANVGTVQKFLNLYNKTSNKVDNDYGASTETAVKEFQKDQGVSVTGQASVNTFNKMIDWLKKQG